MQHAVDALSAGAQQAGQVALWVSVSSISCTVLPTVASLGSASLGSDLESC